MILRPQYEIGQTVFHPGYHGEVRARECPDCLSKGTWSVTTPAGETFDMICATCCPYLGGPHLRYTVYVPYVRALTIGQAAVETDGATMKYRYMCRETGIGSGSVYYESDLCETRETADTVARFRAHEQQEAYDKRVAHSVNEIKRRPRRKPKKEGA